MSQFQVYTDFNATNIHSQTRNSCRSCLQLKEPTHLSFFTAKHIFVCQILFDSFFFKCFWNIILTVAKKPFTAISKQQRSNQFLKDKIKFNDLHFFLFEKRFQSDIHHNRKVKPLQFPFHADFIILWILAWLKCSSQVLKCPTFL